MTTYNYNLSLINNINFKELYTLDNSNEKQEILNVYNIELVDWKQMLGLDAIIIAVAHEKFKFLNNSLLKEVLNKNGCIVDIKSFLKKKDHKDIITWKL